MANDEKNDKAGKVVWEPGAAKVAPERQSPVEAAAALAQRLASGHVTGVHITVWLDDGRMERSMYGVVNLAALAWMGQYVIRDALAMNDGIAAGAALPQGTTVIEPKP